MAVTTKKAIRSGEPVKIDKLEEKKRGRPSLVSNKVQPSLGITSLCDARGVVNTIITRALKCQTLGCAVCHKKTTQVQWNC